MKKVSIKKLQEGFISFLKEKKEVSYKHSYQHDNTKFDNIQIIKKELLQYINNKILKTPIHLKQKDSFNDILLINVVQVGFDEIYGPSVQFTINRFGSQNDELIIIINYEKNKVEISPRSIDSEVYTVSKEDLEKLHDIFMRINNKFEEDNRNIETIKMLNDKFKIN